MTDIFQISSKAADAAPGKGTGETLISPPETYSELRAIPGWRRLLVSGSIEPLPLTKSAELWEAGVGKKARVRRTDLEEQRAKMQAQGTTSKLEETMEAPAAAPAPPKKRTAKELFAEMKAKKEAAAVVDEPAPAAAAAAAAAAPAVVEKKESKKKTKTAVAASSAPEVGAEAKEEEKPKKSRAKSKKGQAEAGNIGEVPEGIIASTAAAAGGAAASVEEPSYTLAPPPLVEEEERNTSTIRFCPVCRYYLYLQVNNPDPSDPSARTLFRLCRNCGFKEEDEKGGLLSEIIVGERSAEGYKILFNEHTKFDPNLPHLRGVMKCPDPACQSNHGKESDIIYMKYDSVNLLYMYICNLCGYRWRSRR